MKIMTILGTRPEIIRLAKIIKELDEHCNHILVHTGQNYDYNLNRIFFKDLGLRLPNYNLKSKSQNIQDQIAKIISSTGEVMDVENPDAVLILGDTNSGLSAIAAKRKKIPIFHIEAGDRSYDNEVPEELNRRIIDHTSDVNIAYSEQSRRNLLREGIHPKNIYVVGSPIIEVYNDLGFKFEKSKILNKLGLNTNQFFTASIHREENVESVDSLKKLVETFNAIIKKYKIPIVVSTHPRTKTKLINSGLIKKSNQKIIWHKPFGLIDFIKLQKESKCVISDSGTIHEDSAVLKFPAIAIRKSTEKQESIEAGYCPITGLDQDDVLRMLGIICKKPINFNFSSPPEAYIQKEVSKKIVRIILGMSKIIKKEVWGSNSMNLVG